jgi:hypothetical protein
MVASGITRKQPASTRLCQTHLSFSLHCSTTTPVTIAMTVHLIAVQCSAKMLMGAIECTVTVNQEVWYGELEQSVIASFTKSNRFLKKHYQELG